MRESDEADASMTSPPKSPGWPGGERKGISPQNGPRSDISGSAFPERESTKDMPQEDRSQTVAGGAAELARWMRQYGDVVLRTAFLLLQDRQMAEDVSQEAFLLAYRKRDQLLDGQKEKSWLLSITTNLCRREMRRASWTRQVVRPTEDLQSSLPDANIKGLVQQSLIDVINRLPYKYREVIVLFYYQSFAVEEIARNLGNPLGTIKSRLTRGRRLLRTMLEKEGWTDAEIE